MYNATWQLTDAKDGLYTHLDGPAGDITSLNPLKISGIAGVMLRRVSVSRDHHSVFR
jgi:hypothetical protein